MCCAGSADVKRSVRYRGLGDDNINFQNSTFPYLDYSVLQKAAFSVPVMKLIDSRRSITSINTTRESHQHELVSTSFINLSFTKAGSQ
jgi:hypothetical protein